LTNAGRQPEEIVIVVDVEAGRRVAINPNEVSQAILDPAADPGYADMADIMLAAYAPRSTDRDLSPHFLDLDLLTVPDLRQIPGGSLNVIFTLGFPTSDTDYNTSYDDNYTITGVDISSRWWKLYFSVAEPT
jgi:hypothetical protein